MLYYSLVPEFDIVCLYVNDIQHHSYTTAETKNNLDWRMCMGAEPYRLASDNLLEAPFPTIKCVVCSDNIMLAW